MPAHRGTSLLTLLTALLTISLAVSCTSPDESLVDKSLVEKTLDRRITAFVTKDLPLYLSTIHPSYSVETEGKTTTVEELGRSFTGVKHFFDKLAMKPRDRVVYLEGDRARVHQRVLVEVEVPLEKEVVRSSFILKESFELERVGGHWLITRETETDYAVGFVFGD